MDFEAHTISDNDFNGVKKLLQQVRGIVIDWLVKDGSGSRYNKLITWPPLIQWTL